MGRALWAAARLTLVASLLGSASPASATVLDLRKAPLSAAAAPGLRSRGGAEAPTALHGWTPDGRPLALRPEVMPAALSEPIGGAAAGGGPAAPPRGGTVCQCICGDRVVWHRLVFPGDVTSRKEYECEYEVCPDVMIPGLEVYAECTYLKDLSELIAGTLCQCQCGDKAAWRNRGFYGDVCKEKERECLEQLCPRVNPLPGVRFEAECKFDPKLFARDRIGGQSTTPLLVPHSAAAPRWRGTSAAAAALAATAAWAGAVPGAAA